MTILSKRDSELVSLGAAIGSNCVPCIVFHIREALDAGLSIQEIREAVDSAHKLKQTPATLVLNAANQELMAPPSEPPGGESATGDCGCQSC